MLPRVRSSKNYYSTPILSYNSTGIPWFKKKKKKEKGKKEKSWIAGVFFLSSKLTLLQIMFDFIVQFLLGNIFLSSDILNHFTFTSLINFTYLILKELRLGLFCFRTYEVLNLLFFAFKKARYSL